jgi:environmental stress-induced protein Ves
MQWELFKSTDYVTTRWSGGTTTQLAISPPEAVYAQRDFLWRLSSAKVELEHSDFTSLPDYVRLISVLDGALEMKIGDGTRFALEKRRLCSFDGATAVESWGRCTDYNLMLRKGKAQGSVQLLELPQGGRVVWTAPVPAPKPFAHCAVALYCAEGDLRVEEAGLTANRRELLLCRDWEDTASVSLTSASGAAVMVAVIES